MVIGQNYRVLRGVGYVITKWSQHRALDGDTVHEGTVGGVSGGIDPAARSRRPATGIRSPQPLMSHFKLDAFIISHHGLEGFCRETTG